MIRRGTGGGSAGATAGLGFVRGEALGCAEAGAGARVLASLNEAGVRSSSCRSTTMPFATELVELTASAVIGAW
jgi:hypothetical protein